MDFGLAKKNILFCAAGAIQIVGTFNFFLKIYFLIVFRNLSFNLFPFLFRERQHFKKSLDKEVRIVYQEVRKLDVVDEHNNVRLVPIEDIFYCHQQRNFTDICTVQNIKYTRLGSMKHLEQLFGEEEFIRITSTVLVPFRYIRSCKGNTVVMQKRAWEGASTTFQLEPKTQEQVAEKIAAALQKYRETASDDTVPQKPKRPKISRKPATPPQEKVLEVLSCIKEHPNCNTTDTLHLHRNRLFRLLLGQSFSQMLLNLLLCGLILQRELPLIKMQPDLFQQQIDVSA